MWSSTSRPSTPWDVVVDVPFADRHREVTVRGVAVGGAVAEGYRVEVVYAPTRPDLGVLSRGTGDFAGTFFGIVVVIAAAGTCLGCTIAGLRRFRARLHLPVMAAVGVAAGLDAVVVYGFPPAAAGHLLPVAAALLLFLTARWAVRAGRRAAGFEPGGSPTAA